MKNRVREPTGSRVRGLQQRSRDLISSKRKMKEVLMYQPDPRQIASHTKAVGFAMDHVFEVIANLSLREVIYRPKPRIRMVDVLDATRRVNGIDSSLRSQLDKIIAEFPLVAKLGQGLSAGSRERLTSIIFQLRGCPNVDALQRQLKRMESGSCGEDEGIKDGARLALHILKDGMDSIYNPDNPYYGFVPAVPGYLRSEKNTGVAAADAAAGAVGLADNMASGVEMAVSASVSKVIENVVNDIVDDILEDDDVPLFEGIEDIVTPPPA
jgi:hypothetical protein